MALAASHAAAQDTNALALGSDLPETGWALLRVLVALAAVLALFFGGVWLFRNWQRLTAGRAQPPKLRVLEVRPLGHRQMLCVVAYEQQRFLLASSPAGVSLLAPLPPGDTAASAPAPLPAFGESLRRALAEQP